MIQPPSRWAEASVTFLESITPLGPQLRGLALADADHRDHQGTEVVALARLVAPDEGASLQLLPPWLVGAVEPLASPAAPSDGAAGGSDPATSAARREVAQEEQVDAAPLEDQLARRVEDGDHAVAPGPEAGVRLAPALVVLGVDRPLEGRLLGRAELEDHGALSHGQHASEANSWIRGPRPPRSLGSPPGVC